jgi:hypothetical protein
MKNEKAMKKLLFILLFSAPVIAQDGFRNEHGNLTWERTFPASINMTAALESQPGILITTNLGNSYTGMGDGVQNTCDSGTALMKNKCKFEFSVRKENGNYIVTVTNLKIIEKFGPLQARIIASRAEKYFVNADLKIKKDVRTQNDMGCLDNFLTTVFSSGTIMASGTLTAASN